MTTSALVCIVRDEEPGIIEFVAYHLGVIGFDRAIIYNNQSTDGTAAQVHRLQRHYDIELIDWPHVRTGNCRPQLLAYEDAVQRLAHEVDWVAFLDADEALHGTAGWRLPELLRTCHGAAQIALNWATFGSSGHVAAPRLLNCEAYTWRAPLAYHVNLHCKVLVRPDRVRRILNPHSADVDGRTVNANGDQIGWGAAPGIIATSPPCAPFRVNHYATRSLAHWERRRVRGAFGRERAMRDFRELDRNDVRDVSAQEFYGAALHREIGRVLPEDVADFPPLRSLVTPCAVPRVAMRDLGA